MKKIIIILLITLFLFGCLEQQSISKDEKIETNQFQETQDKNTIELAIINEIPTLIINDSNISESTFGTALVELYDIFDGNYNEYSVIYAKKSQDIYYNADKNSLEEFILNIDNKDYYQTFESQVKKYIVEK